MLRPVDSGYASLEEVETRWGLWDLYRSNRYLDQKAKELKEMLKGGGR